MSLHSVTESIGVVGTVSIVGVVKGMADGGDDSPKDGIDIVSEDGGGQSPHVSGQLLLTSSLVSADEAEQASHKMLPNYVGLHGQPSKV